MTPPRRRGRRIPPKTGRSRPAASSSGVDEPDDLAAGSPESGTSEERATTRSQNRAAKRAATARTKPVRRGPVRATGRSNLAAIILVIGLVAVGAAVFAFGNPFGAPAPTMSASPFGDGTCPTSQPAALPTTETKYVTITTDMGEIVVKVDGALSPIAAGNFVALAECQFYDGVVFHRTATMQDGTPFVIQGGDPLGTGGGGPGYTIEDETVNTTYKRGTVAMARTQEKHSQGSQFFIVLDDGAAGPLSSANTYAIFGEVIAGMDVADAIYEASGGQELPADPIEMTSVTVSDEPPPSAAPSASPAASGSPAPNASPNASPAGSPAATPASTP